MNAGQGAQLAEPIGERDHVRGPATARVTVVQYGDYQCPFSGEAWGVMLELQRRHPDELRYVFRNFPLSHVHPNAQHAAEAAEAAGAQGKFWAVHDTLFENQRWLDDESLLDYATGLGLDVDRFAREMMAHAYAERVQDDIASGRQSAVQGTPTFFVNGVQQGSPSDLDATLATLARIFG
jgi:protein-disulfide isomerase